jgi:hypothetical protein
MSDRADDSHGWSALAKAACWLEDVVGLTVEFAGARSFDKFRTRTLEASGRFLFYKILVDGGWLWVSAYPLDSGTQEHLMSVGDGPSGWRTTCRLILALERSELRSLERPIGLGGEEGPDSWVIY